MLSRFDTIPERGRQTDGRTDSIAVLTRDKKPSIHYSVTTEVPIEN